MAVATPDWVKMRGGELKASSDGNAVAFYLNGTPLYVLTPIPARGKFACKIQETINGHRLDKDITYNSPADALAGGLIQLREALGW
jgi:hypothetical protein